MFVFFYHVLLFTCLLLFSLTTHTNTHIISGTSLTVNFTDSDSDDEFFDALSEPDCDAAVPLTTSDRLVSSQPQPSANRKRRRLVLNANRSIAAALRKRQQRLDNRLNHAVSFAAFRDYSLHIASVRVNNPSTPIPIVNSPLISQSSPVPPRTSPRNSLFAPLRNNPFTRPSFSFSRSFSRFSP